MSENTKTCSRCKTEKPMAAFSRDKQHFTGYKSACKVCASGDFKAWRKKNHQKAKLTDRVNHYIRSYGLSEKQARQLVADRTGICSICGNTTQLVVDHCHNTGRVRGLICSACNSVLGYAKDNINTLSKAIEYLEKFYE